MTNFTQKVNILPKLELALLLSVGKLMDEGCKAHFTKDKAIILKNNETILQGHQNTKDGLYDVDFKITTDHNLTNEKIEDISRQKINIIVQVDTKKQA